MNALQPADLIRGDMPVPSPDVASAHPGYAMRIMFKYPNGVFGYRLACAG